MALNINTGDWWVSAVLVLVLRLFVSVVKVLTSNFIESQHNSMKVYVDENSLNSSSSCS